MNSRTTEQFRKVFDQLSPQIQEQAREAYRLFVQNPQHPSLRFKKIHKSQDIYSVRISQGYRALGVLEDDTMIWFWIGSHADYDQLIDKL
jgi:mRNA-degrading endonuclease RelE of RelBE toxin-antitoxin system